jgi:SAM-dependent methyltransferase
MRLAEVQMKFVKIDPPGTFCFHQAVDDVMKNLKFTPTKTSFVEVGCGAGVLSLRLCKKGYSGMGMDFSRKAIEIANENLSTYISRNQYQLVENDVTNSESLNHLSNSFDLAFSMMVMEHVEDDIGFLKNLANLTKKGGYVMVAVPSRKDRWSIEDETVGHLRRYEREDLQQTLSTAGLEDVQVISVAVPTANFLFRISNFLVKNSDEITKVSMSMKEQTQTSGIREYPLFLIQRLFYKSDLGLTMLAVGRKTA